MPELAECRWLQQNLQTHLAGAQIISVRVKHHNLIPQRKTDDIYLLSCALTKRLRSLRFKQVHRRGKYLMLELEPTSAILLHMRFTGWYCPEWAPQLTNWDFLHGMDLLHDPRLIIYTDRGRVLVKDNRCLSRFEIYRTLQGAQARVAESQIGPDVDTPEGLRALLTAMKRHPRRAIRDLLLDQTVAAGMGNYLTAEILHRAGLHGSEQLGDFNPLQQADLLRHIIRTIRTAENTPGYDWWEVFMKTQTPDGRRVYREEWKGRGHYTVHKGPTFQRRTF